MNLKIKKTIEILIALFTLSIRQEKEYTLMQITKTVNSNLRDMGFVSDLSPKQVAVYIRKFLDMDIEKRGHMRNSYPIVYKQLLERFEKLNLDKII